MKQFFVFNLLNSIFDVYKSKNNNKTAIVHHNIQLNSNLHSLTSHRHFQFFVLIRITEFPPECIARKKFTESRYRLLAGHFLFITVENNTR